MRHSEQFLSATLMKLTAPLLSAFTKKITGNFFLLDLKIQAYSDRLSQGVSISTNAQNYHIWQVGYFSVLGQGHPLMLTRWWHNNELSNLKCRSIETKLSTDILALQLCHWHHPYPFHKAFDIFALSTANLIQSLE